MIRSQHVLILMLSLVSASRLLGKHLIKGKLDDVLDSSRDFPKHHSKAHEKVQAITLRYNKQATCDWPTGVCTYIYDPCPPGKERCPQNDDGCSLSTNHCCCNKQHRGEVSSKQTPPTPPTATCDWPTGVCSYIYDPCPPGKERCPQNDDGCPRPTNHCCCNKQDPGEGATLLNDFN